MMREEWRDVYYFAMGAVTVWMVVYIIEAMKRVIEQVENEAFQKGYLAGLKENEE
jgi:hypothetical protein